MSDSTSADPSPADSITETSSKNIFQRLGGALVAAAFGIILFLGAIGVLVWNESRAVDAIRGLGQAAHVVVEASPTPIDRAQDGHLVHLTGALVVHDTLSDPDMGLAKGNLVRLKRKVEMYQWEQHEQSHSSTQLGGTKTTQTTYSYTKKWSEDPIDSSDFRGNHANPDMPIRTQVFTSTDTTIGDRKVTSKLLDDLDTYAPLALPASTPDGYRREGSSFYKGNTPDAPRIGDLRITFAGVPAQTVSIMAAQRGSLLEPFKTRNGYKVGLVVPGDQDADAMVAEKRSEEKLLTWILRGVGFLCFFIALLLLAAPLTTLSDVLPFLGSIVGGGAFFFALVLAIALTFVVIALSWVLVRPLIALGLLAGACLVVVAYHRLRPRKQPSFLPR